MPAGCSTTLLSDRVIRTDWLDAMVRKGRLQEIMSKAIHADDPKLYRVAYRDLDQLKEVQLEEFLRLSENFQVIPASRIVYVKRKDDIIYRKTGTTAAVM